MRQGYVVITSRLPPGAETGAKSTSLACVGLGADSPTTWFETQSVHSHTKRYEGASGLSHIHRWRELTTVDRSWRGYRGIDIA